MDEAVEAALMQAGHQISALAANERRLIDEIAALRKDAERWRKLRAMVRGERQLGSARPAAFAFPSIMELPPLADIMRGSVAQHLDAAIDALPAVGAA